MTAPPPQAPQVDDAARNARPDHRPRPAPPLRRVLAHAGLEARVLLSNGEQLMVAIVLPAMVLIGLRLLPVGRPRACPRSRPRSRRPSPPR